MNHKRTAKWRIIRPGSINGASYTRECVNVEAAGLLFSFLVPIGTVVVVLLIAEIVLQFLPVSSSLRAIAVSADHPVFHFEPNRSFLHSLGWDMHNINRGRINNASLVNDQDYRRDDRSPLQAVVGDSYIEARRSKNSDRLHYRTMSRSAAAHGSWHLAARADQMTASRGALPTPISCNYLL